MTHDEAVSLLSLSRQVRWDFPTSSGRPVRGEPTGDVARLVEARPRLGDAVLAFETALEPDLAAELAARCWRLWILARDVPGGRAFLAPVVDGPATRWRSLVRYGDGLLAFWQGDLAASRARSEAALADAGADPEALALGHLGVARAAVSDADAAKGTEHALAARARARDLGEPFEQAPLHMHAQARLLAQDLDEAAVLFEESLALNRRLQDAGMVVCELHNLGFVQVRRGAADAAEQLFAECERLSPAEDPFARAFGELNRGAVAFVRRDPGTARLKLGAAEALLREAGLDPDGEADVRWLREKLTR